MASWRDLPGPARAIGAAVTRAVGAAVDADPDAYETATVDLIATPTEATGIVLAATVRTMLEARYADGLDGDDIKALLARCVKRTAAWLPIDRIDVNALIAVLASALGVHEAGVTYDELGPAARSTDEWRDPFEDSERTTARAPSPAAYAWHAPLLIADLIAEDGLVLARHLDGAFGEIVRAETMEMP